MLPATSQEQNAFLSAISSTGKKAVGLSLFSLHQDAFVVNECPPVKQKLPISLLSLYKKTLVLHQRSSTAIALKLLTP